MQWYALVVVWSSAVMLSACNVPLGNFHGADAAPGEDATPGEDAAPGELAQQTYIKASNTAAANQFGESIALSADGSTLAVGVQRENRGAGVVYVFTRSGATWRQQANLMPPLGTTGTTTGDLFGCAVALSADGSTLAIGACGEDSAATGIAGNQADDSASNAGAVYVYTRIGTTWGQPEYLKASNTGMNDQFGFMLALSGDGSTLAVAGPNEASAAKGIDGTQSDNSAAEAGAVYVFTRGSGVTWSQQAYVKASNTDAGDFFGAGLALSNDGSTLAVGAAAEDSPAKGVGGDQTSNGIGDSGAVYVFTRSGTHWSQQAYVKASNPGASNSFGYALALSGDGSTLAVGAALESSAATGIDGKQDDGSAAHAGAAYVFTRQATTWTQQAYVKASNTGVGDLFGSSVALSGDGSLLAVGARRESSAARGIGGNQADNLAMNAGAVYMFATSGTSRIQQAYVKASNTGAGDNFGFAVVLSGDGSILAVSANLEASAATGIDGVQDDNSAPAAGAVYVFFDARQK